MIADLRRRIAWGVALGVLAVGLSVALSCALGAQPVSPWAALRGREPDAAIVLQLRLPRALLAALVGAALAGAGVALQALLRNVLAEPYVLGVAGGAALGGSLVILAATAAAQALGAGAVLLSHDVPVALGAMAGAAASAVLVFGLARARGRTSPETALLFGVVFNAFVLGVITLLRVLVPPEQAARLTYWLVGTIAYQGPEGLGAGAVAVGAALGLLFAFTGRLNLLTLADEEAASLGVEVDRTRAWVFFGASAATGAAVALGGMIGFVGLIVPHLVRRATGPDHRVLLPASALFGAAFVVLADALARVLFLPLGTEPPVGAVTAFLGGPFFFWLLRRAVRAEAGGAA
ncbi:MAG TPA: iron ABC transporter permease [Anaeromyxobacter sp.]|nr:iron ABC transporter permease [Anaeromyxobacter sp.]